MLTDQELQDLIAYRPGRPVLSAYLNVEPSEGSADAHKLRMRQLLKPYEQEAPADTEAVERFLEFEYDWSGRSLVVFSCAADEFFRSYSFLAPLRSRARLLDRPYVKPLAEALDFYGNYGIALVDKQNARLFRFHLGELEEAGSVMGEAVRHTKRGGGSQAPGRRGGVAGQTRYAEEVADRNLKEAAAAAARFFQEHNARRVILGGSEANVARFQDLLPKSWQSLIVGTITVDLNAGPAEVQELAMEVASEGEEAKKARLVEAVITAAAKGREGVIRLDDTLDAVSAGRVQTLLISEGYRAPGYRCRGCGFLTVQTLEQCPFCGKAFAKIEDAVEMSVRRVLTDGGEVEVIYDNEALDRAGRIGALLRY